MIQTADDQSRPDLVAFADGELGAAASADVLEFLAAHPDDAKMLARMMRFRAAVAKNMESATPPVSDVLESRISRLLTRNTGQAKLVMPAWRPRSHGFFGLAAAALLLLSVGLGSGWMLFRPHEELAGPVPGNVIQRVDQVHVECSRAPSLHNLPFPHELGDLEGELKTYLGRGEAYPDLSAVGYKYVGTGECTNFLPGMVHLLYQSTRRPVTDTLSVFVREYHGEGNLLDGKVYWAQAKDAAHPTLLWRKGGLVFFLVGDAAKPVVEAAESMHVNVPL